MAGALAQCFVEIRPRFTSFDSELQKKLDSSTKDAETKTSGIGSKLSSIAPAVASIAAAGIAAGAALLDVGEKFEVSTNTIISKTGASGAALGGLKTSFDDVLATTPGATFGNVADALSEVYDRTKLTGPALDKLTSQFVELGKITGTDAAADAQQFTALFGQFGVTAAQQGPALDVLFKASQQAGVSITDLASNLQAAAPVAQSLGLNIDQTTALVANLTKAGLPASKVMMGLGSEFAKAAKAGKDPTTVISAMVAQIKAAPTATDAATIAVKNFGIGARQAATLVDAVRAGTLNFGTTLASITSGKGGIAATAAATETMGDRLKQMKNEGLVAIQPVASALLDFVNEALPKITSLIGEYLPTAISDVKLAFADAAPVIADVFADISTAVTTVAPVIEGVFSDISAALGSFLDGFSGTAKQGSSFFVDFGNAARALVSFFEGTVIPTFKRDLLPILQTVGKFIDANLKPILITLGITVAALISPLAVLVAGFIYAYQQSSTFRDVISVIAGLLVDTLGYAFREIGLEISTFVGIMEDLIHFVTDIFEGRWSDAFNALLDIPTRVFGLITGTVGNLITLFEDLPSKLTGALAQLPGLLWAAISGAFTFVVGQIPGAVAGIVAEIAKLPTALLSLDVALVNAGEHLLEQLLKGLGSAAGGALDVAKNIANDLIDYINSQVIDPLKKISIGAFGIHATPFDILPDIPRLAAGGVVGSDGPAYLHAGEAVINPASSASRQAGLAAQAGLAGAGGGPMIGELHLHEVSPGGAATNASEVVRRLAAQRWLRARA